MMKKKLIIGTLLCFVFSFAQQNVQYTQYMYNTMSFNPGYTATRGVPNILALYRAQWIGIDGAPKTMVLSGQTPINDNQHGIGFTIENDKIGPSSETRLALSYAYPVKLSDDVIMSLGVNLTGDFLELNYNKLQILNHDDSELRGKLSRFSPNIGAGAYFYSNKWFAGLSIPDFLETEFYDDIQASVAKKKMHYYAVGGYCFNLSNAVQFKPSSLIQIVEGAPLGINIASSFLIQDSFLFGIAYRWGGTLSFLTEIKVTDGIKLGYAYDYNGGSIGKNTTGTHEAFLLFDILKSKKKQEDGKENDPVKNERNNENVNKKKDFRPDWSSKENNVKTERNPIPVPVRKSMSKAEKKQLKKEAKAKKEQAKREKNSQEAKAKLDKEKARKAEKEERRKAKAKPDQKQTDKAKAKAEKKQLKKEAKAKKEQAKREKNIQKAKAKMDKEKARKAEKEERRKAKAKPDQKQTDKVKAKAEKKQLKKEAKAKKEQAKREKNIQKAKAKMDKEKARKAEKEERRKAKAKPDQKQTDKAKAKAEKKQLKKEAKAKKEQAKREKNILIAKEKAAKKKNS